MYIMIDKKVRDKAVASLVAFLSQGGDTEGSSSTYVNLEDKEMAKLWKGLFYCLFSTTSILDCLLTDFRITGFWMSDKPLIQQGLAAELAELLLKINPRTNSAGDKFKASLAFLEGFWDSIAREWAGIDRLRYMK